MENPTDVPEHPTFRFLTRREEEEKPPAGEIAASIIDSIGIGVIVMNAAGRVQSINHKVAALFGIGIESGPGMSFEDFFPPPLLRDSFISLLDVIPGHRTASEEVALTPRGERFWASVWFKSFGEGAEVERIVAVIEDASSTKKEFELIDSISRRLSSILDLDRLLPEIVKLIKESFGFYNVNIGLVEGDYVVVRAGYGGYWGKADQELKGEIKLRISQEGIIGRVAATNQPILVPDASKDPSFFYFPPLGESISEVAVPISSKNRIIGVLDVQNNKVGGVTLNDLRILSALASQISVAIENASLWAEIRKSREQYYELYEKAPDMYHTVNRDGVVIRCNNTEAEALGYPKEEIIGKPFLEFFDQQDRKKVWEAVFGEESPSSSPRAVDARRLRKDGTSVDVSVSGKVVRDASGRTLSAGIVAKDITEKKKLEQQVFHSQKMESLGNLAGGIAHDFNNLLASILGFTSYLKTIAPEGEIKSCLNVIEESIERGTEITDRLLSFSSAEAGGSNTRVDVPKIIEGTLALLERSIEKNISIVRSIDPDVRSLRCNPGHIQQILMNLCLNARDAMPDGGTLTVGARNIPKQEIVKLIPNAELAFPFVGIFVRDTGIGIPPENEIKIFEPFFTTKKKGSSTGLGLAVTYTLVKKYGGYINLESKVGSGSTFTIILPVKKTTRMLSSPPRKRPTGGSETILIVDDEKTIRKFSNLALIKQGYKVIEAENGKEAVRIFEERKDEIDLVILDLVMPVMGGEEAFERMIALKPDSRFIISTGFASAAKNLLRTGKAVLLPKPYNVKQLCESVRDTLDRKSRA